jgi:hypothetical protein
MADNVDSLDGHELELLNAMLVKIQPAARAGDVEAIDRVLKILALRRQYRDDYRVNAREWKGAKR